MTPSVKWSSIELPKSLGGLGVGNILYKNLVLLFKWWWRFSGSNNTLWKRILISVHNIKGFMANSDSFGRIKTGSWAYLMSNDAATKKVREIVEQGMSCAIGDGRSIRFWHDKWASVGPLRRAFQRLFMVSSQGDAMVNQMGNWVDNEWVWHLSWRRRLYDWEKEDLERLNLLLEQAKPVVNGIDSVNWHGTHYEKFPIKEIVDRLYESDAPMLPKAITSYIWSIKVPPRVHLTIWMASLEKLKTGDLLVSLGLLDRGQALCPFCAEEVESNRHVLFTCTVSWRLWMRILDWWGVKGVLPDQCVHFILAWKHLAPFRRKGKVWRLILGCVIWSIWFERNKIKFNHGALNEDHLFYTLKIRISVWAKELLGFDLASSIGFSSRFFDLRLL